ncbi:hypothetical protein HAZT_HAZT005409 [Hyalella azteca]|uniref:Mediator of RNA polymerase II transcription subunit 18 n=1 Tax=Hyalella azteca TaxID=294128 RepID=A0A6A0H8F4_HYAAZ|nr:mediator of RNA polymerase II transcription subunit 18 [Hyalella azteca]KAA0201521.1 hypothetical protein HAZT_HAZT005409 [Hyalella azteca]
MSINLSVQSVLDSIESAQKNDIVPDQEFVLQGSVMDLSVSVLLSRLRGLCDNADSLPETFHDQEICFILKDFSNPGAVGPGTGGVMLRVRKALDHPELPWQLRYTGQPEVGNRPALLRNCLDVPVSSNICDFLHELGAKVDHEYVSKGYIMRKGRIKVTVFKIFKVGGKEVQEGVTKSHVVELSALTTRVDEAIATDLRIVADQLKPLVNLQNLDYRRL